MLDQALSEARQISAPARLSISTIVESQ
jgi:hypothetical protein